jgi:hypothetical protein
VSGQLQAPAALPPGKKCCYPLDRRLAIKFLAGLRKGKPSIIMVYATYGQTHT